MKKLFIALLALTLAIPAFAQGPSHSKGGSGVAFSFPNALSAGQCWISLSTTSFGWGTCPGGSEANTTSTALTTNHVPRANGPNSIINSGIEDDGTTIRLKRNTIVEGELSAQGTGATTLATATPLAFEGATDDNFETTFTVVDPTADRTVNVPNANSTTVVPATAQASKCVSNIDSTGTQNVVDCGGAGGTSVTIADEGTSLTQRATVNFLGSGVSCADNAGATRTDCTINTGSGASPLIVFNNTPTTAVAGTGAEATIYSTTVNSLNAGGCIRVTLMYTFSTASATNTSKVVGIKYGTAAITWTSTNTSTTDRYTAQALICNNPGSQAAQKLYTLPSWRGTSAGSSPVTPVDGTVDATTSQTLSWTWNAATDNALTPAYWLVERLH